jgi:chromosome partitioning protein
MGKLLETINLVAKRINRDLKVSGVVLCMYETGTKLANEVVADMEQFFTDARGQASPWAHTTLFKTRIRRNIKLAEAPSFGQEIFTYAPTSNGAEDYAALAKEVLAMTGEKPATPAAVVPSGETTNVSTVQSAPAKNPETPGRPVPAPASGPDASSSSGPHSGSPGQG